MKVGDKYNLWTVISESEKRSTKGERYFTCKCDCGTLKDVRTSHLKNSSSKSCGCYSKSNNKKSSKILLTDFERLNYPESILNRFWKYVNKLSNNECWNWIGSLSLRGGYGQLSYKGGLLKAHKISYEIHKGIINKGLYVCHKCNNPKCCNPAHLYSGTPKNNWDDTIKTGNAHTLEVLKGENSPSSRIKYSDVLFIRKSNKTLKELGDKFGISKTSVSNIKKNKTWKTKN